MPTVPDKNMIMALELLKICKNAISTEETENIGSKQTATVCCKRLCPCNTRSFFE